MSKATKKTDNSWMKRSDPTAAATTAKDVEIKPIAFPTKTSTANLTSGKNESDKTSLTRGSRRSSGAPGRSSTGVGRKIGASRLHWLKRNWILCGLIVFALFGCLMAIIMFSLPCEPIFKEVSITLTQRIKKTVTTSQLQCSGVVDGATRVLPATCPANTKATVSEQCEKDTCVTSSGESTTDANLCERTSISEAEPCPTDTCYSIDLDRKCTTTTVCKATSETTTTPQTCGAGIEVVVDFDAMILLDVSGSVSNTNWNKEVDVAVKVIETIQIEVRNDHKKAGFVAWSGKVQAAQKLTDLKDSAVGVNGPLDKLKGDSTNPIFNTCNNFGRSSTYPFANDPAICPNSCAPSYCPAFTGGRQFSGGTQYSNPLAECANELLKVGEASTKESAYKMCMLITDGSPSPADKCVGGTVLDRTACKSICNELQANTVPPATQADGCTAKFLAKQLRTQKKISIVVACVACPSIGTKRDAYCYSDCADLPANGGSFTSCSTAAANYDEAKLEECTHFVIADDFNLLDQKLVDLTKKLTTTLAKVTVGKTSATAPAVATVSEPLSGTESVDTNTTEEGCQDPGWFWLLLFFLPLILYLLYYPFKRHYQAKKDRLRELLHERRLLKHMQADEIRAAVEEAKLAAAAAKSGNSKGGTGNGGTKKKYKWDIKAADQYLWATSEGGAMKVDFGKMGAPPSAPKAHHTKKELRMADGTVLKGAAAEKAIQEMKEQEAKEKHQQYEQDIKLAEELERAGQLEEDGDFWLRFCPCCREILVEEGEVDEERIEIEEDIEAQKLQASGKAGQHNRGASLFDDNRAKNSANPAAFAKK